MGSSYNILRADRIRKEVKTIEVLYKLGFPVSPKNAEQQFSCSLHGNGRDRKPSAHYYPESNSFYCFACATNRDSIQTLREVKGISFAEALSQIESWYNLPPLPFSDSAAKAKSAPAIVAPKESISLDGITSLLAGLTKERSIDMRLALECWEVHDKIHYVKDRLSPEQARQAVDKLKEKIFGPH